MLEDEGRIRYIFGFPTVPVPRDWTQGNGARYKENEFILWAYEGHGLDNQRRYKSQNESSGMNECKVSKCLRDKKKWKKRYL